jgi:hypothetical protein
MPKPRVRKFHGVPLIKVDDDTYRTLDGEYEITADHNMESWCDGPHPVRVSNALREQIRNYIATYHGSDRGVQHARSVFTSEAVDAYLHHARGYYCYGGEVHSHTEWVAHEAGGSGWQGEWSDTPTDAAYDLARHLEKQNA